MEGSRRRLCIVTPNHWSGSKGGAEYQIECLLEALSPLNRHDIYYIARCVARDFKPAGYRIVQVGKSNRIPRLGLIFDAVPLYRILRSIRPDVIYQRVACGYTGIAAFYARTHGARMIWHLAHDTDVTPGESLDVGRNLLRRFLEKSSIEYAIKNASTIVAQTMNQSRLLRKHYKRAADQVIPNFHPEPKEAINKGGPLTVLWIANLKPWKQPEAFVRLANTLNDLQGVRFVMVGANSTGRGDKTWLEALMRDIDQTNNLSYVGEKSQQQVNELLAAAHLFVNTSLQEGFPNTFIQAWMREVPVVSLHVDPDGILEREGIGIYARSEQEAAEATRRLLESKLEREALGKRSRAHALTHHSLRNIDLLISLIDEVDGGSLHDRGRQLGGDFSLGSPEGK